MIRILLLLLLSASVSAQTYLDFRKPVRMLYGGDTLIISLQGDSVIFSGEAAELVLRDSTLLELIQEHGGGVGGEIYASNGAYKDGDTVKLGGGTRIKDNTTIGEQSNSIIYFDNQYQKGIMLYVSKKPSGSAQSVSSIQLKSHYNPSLLPTEKLDSSTYIQFTSTHIPVGTSGKYAEARFNENGFYYTDTLRGRNANNPRWIPDKDYIDSVSGTEYFAGSGIIIVNDTIKFSGSYSKTGSIQFHSLYAGDYSSLVLSPGGITTLSNTDDVNGNVSFQLNSDLQNISMVLGSGPIFKANSYGFKFKQFSGSLTDGAPTASEITAIIGINASSTNAGAGFQVTIKDTDGTGLLYKIESDGSSWYYTAMTKAL